MEQEDIEHAATLLKLLGETGRLQLRVRVDQAWSHNNNNGGESIRVEVQMLVDDVVVACDTETCLL